jgi:hypothetical protein
MPVDKKTMPVGMAIFAPDAPPIQNRGVQRLNRDDATGQPGSGYA